MKIAIFHCEEIPTLFMLEDAARKVGFEPYVFHFSTIRPVVSEKSFDLLANGVSLKSFSAVFCRGFWDYQQEVSILVEFCRLNNIKVFDSALLTRQMVSKMHDLLVFKEVGLPVPKTVFGENINDEKTISEKIQFPIVAKENRSRKGFDVYLLKNKKQLKDFLVKNGRSKKTLSSPTYQFQEFIHADFDVRVIVIGGKILGAIERRSGNPKEFRHNISLGGTPTKIHIGSKMEKMAVLAAEALNYEFAGVDFITDKHTGRTYILEVNRSPGFEGFMAATGIDLPLELMKFFLRFLEKKIK